MYAVSAWVYMRLAKKRTSHYMYKLSVMFTYLTEIIVMYTLFILFLKYAPPPISYDEKSSVKIFIDFFTFYQISVFILTKSISNISDKQYKTYLILLRKTKINLEAQRWSRLEVIKNDINKPENKYKFGQTINKAIESLSELIEIVVSQKNKNETKINDQQSELKFSEMLNEVVRKIDIEIAETELLLEEFNRWSGSITLSLAPDLIQIYKIVREDKYKRYRRFNVLVSFIKNYHYYIVKLIVILILILLYP